MKTQIIINAAILPFGKEPVLPTGAIAWNQDSILAIGSTQSILNQFPGAEIVDAKGRVVTPGLINLHTHLYSTLARGLTSPAQPPADFREILSSFWWKWDKCLDLEDVQLSAELGLIECLSCGVTTVFDHHSSPNAVLGSLERIAKAYRNIGLRGSLCYEVSDRDGLETSQNAIEENLSFAKLINSNDFKILMAHFGLHANFTLSDDTLREVANRLTDNGISIHIHLCEDDSDNQAVKKLGYTGPAERLDHFGLLNQKSLLIHGVHLNPDQWDIVRNRKSHLIHNPASNLNNAVGIAPINDILEIGISVGLGTDGDGNNMIASANLAALSAKHKSNDPRQGNWAISLLTEANPRIASKIMNKSIGVLKTGAVADIVLWDYLPATLLNDDTVTGHLLFGLQYSKPENIWVNGNLVWGYGHATSVNQESLIMEAQKRVPDIWNRFQIK
jgi:putative selenium metabolism protein SsnA